MFQLLDHIQVVKKFKKELINIRNNDQMCFVWCHVRHINPVKIHPEKITQEDKKLLNSINYDKVGFQDFSNIENKNNICMNVFCYENKLTFPIYVLDQKFENSMDLSLVTDENKSRYVYIKDITRFMFHKTNNKNKKYFCKSCLQCFSSKNKLPKQKEVCLGINDAQSVRLQKGTIEFKNLFKQIPVPFQIYADFDCNLKSVESYEGFYSKNIKITFLVVLFTNLFMYEFTRPIFVIRGENSAFRFIEAIVKEYGYCKKVMKKHFNQNSIMSEKEEEEFQ